MDATKTLSLVERRVPCVAPRARFTLVGPARAPVVVVLGGISANRDVVHSNVSRGWWGDVAGEACAIDTTRFRVLGVDFLDGGRDADGRPQRIVTTHEQAGAIASILESQRIERVHAFVGSSYGGMVALAFAERYGTALDRLVVISAAHESHQMSTALRSLQRRIVELGIETGRVADAMSIARGLAMTTYRSATEFAERFSAIPLSRTRSDARFEVDGYLRNHGRGFSSTMRPERFLALSLSADLHRVVPSSITTPCTLVAAEGDRVVPFGQMSELAKGLGGLTTLELLPTRVGHDAFLVETEQLSTILSAALD